MDQQFVLHHNAKLKAQKMWQEIKDNFQDEERHRYYVGFCLRNHLILEASRNYSRILSRQPRNPIARRYQRHLINLLFMSQSSVFKEKRLHILPRLWLVFGATIESVAIFLLLISWVTHSTHRWQMLIVSGVCMLISVYTVYRASYLKRSRFN